MQIILIMFADFMPFEPPALAAVFIRVWYVNNNNNNNNNNKKPHNESIQCNSRKTTKSKKR